MAVYRLKKKQMGPWCSYCENRAVHRGCGFRKFACPCPECLEKLKAADQQEERMNSYETEGERLAMRMFRQ